MSTLIQTCLDQSQYMETSSQVLKLNIRDDDQFKSNVCSANSNGNGNGMSFLQFLSNISSTPKQNIDKENVYFHPLSKSISSRLSEKSLQLCTENLGCETGCTTFIMDYVESIQVMPVECGEEKVEEKESYSYSNSIKKVKSYSAFPPPLTTMSGEKSLQIRTNREGGRLITKAFEIPCQESCFVADRSDGRLRLRVLNKDIGINIVDHDEDENETMGDNECDDDDEDAECDYDEENSEKLIVMSKEIVVGVEKMGKEKFPRRIVRCKECTKGLGNNNWEPLWVATS